MTLAQLKRSLKKDPFNLFCKRNRRNTPCTEYNCGGFALGTYDWVTPYFSSDARARFIEFLVKKHLSREELEKQLLQEDVGCLIEKYPFLVQTTLSECSEQDTVIAYRLFVDFDPVNNTINDTDFHFRIRINGFWFEKPGRDPVQLCETTDESWFVEPEFRYTSAIAYFKVRKDLHNA